MKSGVKIVNLILAAGNATRMGKPKQLLQVNGQTLIENIIHEALLSEVKESYVVLGAYESEIRKKISCLNVKLITNSEWQNGMATSIVKGVTSIAENEEKLDAIIILLADQPLVNVNIINRLIHSFVTTQASIVVSNYGQGYGPPVLFDKSLFSELLTLNGKEGAKKIIDNHFSLVQQVDFPEGIVDIDTPEDFEFFNKNRHI